MKTKGKAFFFVVFCIMQHADFLNAGKADNRRAVLFRTHL